MTITTQPEPTAATAATAAAAAAAATPDAAFGSPTTVALYVCTHQRNEMLRALVDAAAESALRARHLASVAIVVVDDNPDGRARAVVADLDTATAAAFELGVHYIHVGGRNIAAARNAGLEAALGLAEWIAVTDDDCTPSPGWISELLAVQQRYDCDAVAGPFVRTAPNDAPRWLVEQPFLDFGEPDIDDGAETDYAGTGNSLWRSAFLRSHPDIRYQPSLGTLGGEDAVFARQAIAAGLTVRYASAAVVTSCEEAGRHTYRYRIRAQLWLGNTTSVTNLMLGSAGRPRLVARGVRRCAGALARPARRLLRGAAPQVRYALFEATYGVGMVLGAVGVKVEHR